VAFCDYGKEFHMWDFSKLRDCDGEAVTGIRLGFRKRDMYNILDICKLIMDKGYRLYMQGVESLNYTDAEMLELLKVINGVHPHCFGIVDTYGAMFAEDLTHFFDMIHENLDPEVCVDFHSHNNYQLSFSFAQQFIKLAEGKRNIVIDGTMEGVSKGIGNLNTELIMDYMNMKRGSAFDMDLLFDMIDRHIAPLKKDYNWSYQIPYYLAGKYTSHANNIIYLQQKGLSTKDICHVLERVEPEVRKRYKYDILDKAMEDYFSGK
jgi:4-hydroxy 2-oxovalerate aldolase